MAMVFKEGLRGPKELVVLAVAAVEVEGLLAGMEEVEMVVNQKLAAKAEMVVYLGIMVAMAEKVV